MALVGPVQNSPKPHMQVQGFSSVGLELQGFFTVITLNQAYMRLSAGVSDMRNSVLFCGPLKNSILASIVATRYSCRVTVPGPYPSSLKTAFQSQPAFSKI